MNLPEQIIEQMPEEVQEAWHTFSTEEQKMLTAFFDDQTQEFLGLGYMDPDTGKATRWTDAKKQEALEVLEEQYRQDLERMEQDWLAEMSKLWKNEIS